MLTSIATFESLKIETKKCAIVKTEDDKIRIYGPNDEIIEEKDSFKYCLTTVG